jgi:hypothetical protein
MAERLDLERRLAEIGAEAFPGTPDLASAVVARLEAGQGVGRRARVTAWPRRRRALVLALALAVLFAAAALASPLRDVLGIGGVRISHVRSLPAAPARPASEAELGRRASVAEARLLVSFPVRLPRALGSPDAAYVRSDPPGGRVTLIYGALALTEFRGDAGPFIEKSLGPGTVLTRVDVAGAPGYRLTGRPHAIVFVDAGGQPREETLRLAGDTLLWTRHGVTYRLEGPASAARALAIARSVPAG